jgi:hypothetical protein
MASMSAPASTGERPVLSYTVGPRRRTWIALPWLCSLYPVLTMAAIYADGVCVRLSLGHWPRTCIDPPVAPVLDELARWMLILVTPAFILNAAIVVAAVIQDALTVQPLRRGTIAVLAFAVITWAGSTSLFAWDPLNIVQWLFD